MRKPCAGHGREIEVHDGVYVQLDLVENCNDNIRASAFLSKRIDLFSASTIAANY